MLINIASEKISPKTKFIQVTCKGNLTKCQGAGSCQGEGEEGLSDITLNSIFVLSH